MTLLEITHYPKDLIVMFIVLTELFSYYIVDIIYPSKSISGVWNNLKTATIITLHVISVVLLGHYIWYGDFKL